MLAFLFLGLKIAFTFLGGFFVLRKKNYLNLLMALSAGMLVGVALFDLIPESLELGKDIETITLMAVVAGGFLIFHVLERVMLIHACNEEDCQVHEHSRAGTFGAMGLAFHGFLDGLAIGVGFSVSPKVGIIIALPIIVHSFVDGLNIVIMLLKDKKKKRDCINWLGIQAVATVFGFFIAPLFGLSDYLLSLMLAFFAGLFLYIGASDLLPEVHRKKSTHGTLLATVSGFLLIFILVIMLH